MTQERELFNIVEAIGEILNGSLHIIHTEYSAGDKESYRIYVKDGYCFDVEKEYYCEPEEVNDYEGVEKDGYVYLYYEEWDGFKNDLTLTGALNLIKTNTHLHVSNQ